MASFALNIIIFIGMMLLMSIACINMTDRNEDRRNKAAGYRTRRSMQSKEAWNIGNKTFGYSSLMIPITELVIIILEYKVLIPFNYLKSEYTTIIINLLVMSVSIFICYLITEHKLKKCMNN